MIIDFHTHAFPDAIAATTIEKLLAEIDNLYPAVHDGTVSGLVGVMDEWGIDLSVVQPVITRASQVNTINAWAQGICSDRLVSFGAIYPHSKDYKKEIDLVVDLGLKGLKFHVEYQGFQVDDEKMLPVYDYALSRGLILLHHAGEDPGFNPPFKSSPRQFARVVKAMQGGTIIAAHLGGHAQWDEVEEYLVGTDIYLDTSMGFDYYSTEQFLRIVKNHGADKILFASDSPWSCADKEIERLRALPLSQEEKDAILGENAQRILGI
ncbi:MAG: amidohydrolase family protein [Eggerthellaceae bacterium]|nr:amidohydrolase family protein [Eggerthellaceae bacterium]